jgi:hypothetical protein
VGRDYRIRTTASHNPVHAAGVDAAIGRLASLQHGNVTYEQLIELGLTDNQIAGRARTGRLYRAHHCVYSVGRPPTSALEHASAAVLACGPGAALSHAPAMTLWRFWDRWTNPFEVTVIRDRRPRGIRVHRPLTLTRRDIRTHLGIRVTSPARTLLDLDMAPRLGERRRRRAVKEALVSPWLNESQLTDLLLRLPHHPGTKLLSPFLAIPNQLTRSGFEDDFPAFCERWDLPRPQMNFPIAGYVADAYFPDHELIVELDSHEFHLNPISFETDRDRDADTLLAGLPTVRITDTRIERSPAGEAERLARILEHRDRHNAGAGPPK